MSWESGAILVSSAGGACDACLPADLRVSQFYLAEKYDTEGKYFGKSVEERTEVMSACYYARTCSPCKGRRIFSQSGSLISSVDWGRSRATSTG